ncbi:urocanate hydratase-like isoform X2 [Paramacrobiotus metropolitanus]|uniref:urocanate hydratase-like isoform X2 n=1 Tax=Paramacrobiotus metropolitanus TaxID=2943436 RepID=UPI002445CAC8|nr:urocanate hydratase-like isoform X2 [Paramacrobiotus metropolitanus]
MNGMEPILLQLRYGIPLNPLPERRARDQFLPHAPVRVHNLSGKERTLAVKNALRYFPPHLHNTLVEEFAEELDTYGHIYMYRFVPKMRMMAFHIRDYPARCEQAAAIMLMICNNLDPAVAQFPEELITYGGNGEMDETQTLAIYSGHPMGLFPSHPDAPRAVITNGMVIPNYSSRPDYDRMFALGVTMYGQMTAGSYCYIGPQGIVHGTTLTLMNAGRKYLNVDDLRGKVFLTSGLGGMSGAQAKAAVIAGCVGIIAEVSREALAKRHGQGWLMEITESVDECIERTRCAVREGRSVSIGYYGNVVTLWEKLVELHEKTGEVVVDLGSDQTSCHNPFNGGYFPVQLSYEESFVMIQENPERFKELVQDSLRRQVNAINYLSHHGMHFWDYGNAFLLEAGRAGADVYRNNSKSEFVYPSYVQDIMGDIFSLGFGPFRWVCTSCNAQDLAVTDAIASEALTALMEENVSSATAAQYKDNLKWIRGAQSYRLVVGSQARILYADAEGRMTIAVAINRAIARKAIKAPVVISRDHHDVSGTDSPFRETSNIYDGSAFTADMAVQNCIGDSFRGATWVALHNGGGVGWGEVINGGFGLVLDGSEAAERRARTMLHWDVNNGITRRSWAGNANAQDTIKRAMRQDPKLRVTIPAPVSDDILKKLES